MATCYSASYDITTNSPHHQRQTTVQVPVQQKDYSRPLHVDCSVEYELPNTAKPPQGVRNEPLLMIHPCYFRKIESQRRSPFVNNLPATRQPQAAAAVKRRSTAAVVRQPQPAAQYPVQYADHRWDAQIPPNLVPISQSYCKRDHHVSSACGTTTTTTAYNNSSGGSGDSGHWTDPERSPDRPEEHHHVHQQQKHHILTGKYRQYLRAHRLHPYVTSAIPLASTFPQIQQVCYNV